MAKKAPTLTKASFERMCNDAGIWPAHRETYRGLEIIVGHGFSQLPERDFQKFGVKEGDYPNGCFATCWAIPQGDKIPVAAVIPDPKIPGVYLGEDAKRAARVELAVKAARAHIDDIYKVRRAGLNG